MAIPSVPETSGSPRGPAEPCPPASPILLRDGRRVTREVNDIPGFAARPMQKPDVDRKFRGNIGKRWPAGKTDAVLQSLWALENSKDIGALLATLKV